MLFVDWAGVNGSCSKDAIFSFILYYNRFCVVHCIMIIYIESTTCENFFSKTALVLYAQQLRWCSRVIIIFEGSINL